MANKEVKVKSYRTKDGKRVKQFRRKQKIAAGVAGVAAIGGLVAAAKNKKAIGNLIKNSRNKAVSAVDEASLKPSVVLAVNVKHGELLNSLAEKQKLTKEEARDLLKATQEIWAGKAGDMPKKIQDSLTKAEGVTKNSEYDVFLVDIKLKKPMSGFDKDKSQLARLDAFDALLDNLESLKVSKRLPSNAYSDAGFYSR